MLDHLPSVGSDKFEDLLACVWKGPEGAEMMDTAMAMECQRASQQLVGSTMRDDAFARREFCGEQRGVTGVKREACDTPYNSAGYRGPTPNAEGRLVEGTGPSTAGRVISMPGHEQDPTGALAGGDGCMPWDLPRSSHGGPLSPSITAPPAPARVESPFANGPSGLLGPQGHTASCTPDSSPSPVRMKAPLGSTGLSGFFNRALHALPFGTSSDSSRQTSTSDPPNVQGMGARDGLGGGRQLSCLGTGRYGFEPGYAGSAGDASGDLAAGDEEEHPRLRRTTRRVVESRHKNSAIWSDAVDDKLAKQEKRMLKNRESAARSRLRRQQFTEALERENSTLRGEVGELRAQVDSMCTQLSHVEQLLTAAKAAGGLSGNAAAAALAYFQRARVGAAAAAAAAAQHDAAANYHSPAQGPVVKPDPEGPPQEDDAGRAADDCLASSGDMATGSSQQTWNHQGPQQQHGRDLMAPVAPSSNHGMAAVGGSLLGMAAMGSKESSLPTSAPSLGGVLLDNDMFSLWKGPSLEIPGGTNGMSGSRDMDHVMASEGHFSMSSGAGSAGVAAWSADMRPYKRSRHSSSC